MQSCANPYARHITFYGSLLMDIRAHCECLNNIEHAASVIPTIGWPNRYRSYTEILACITAMCSSDMSILRIERKLKINRPAHSLSRRSDYFYFNTIPGYQPLLARNIFGSVISMISRRARCLSSAC